MIVVFKYDLLSTDSLAKNWLHSPNGKQLPKIFDTNKQ